MKFAIAACVMIAAGCKQGDKGTTAQGSAAGSATSAGSGSSADSGSAVASGSGAGSGSAACVITVMIKQNAITYDGGGLAGNVDRKPGEAPNLDVLKRFAGKCSAFITAEPSPTVLYQDVIAVMDTLVKDGIVDVTLGAPGDKPSTDTPPRKRPGLPGSIDARWTTSADGKLVLEGKVTPQPEMKERLKNVPVLIVTKTQVTFAGKEIAKPDDSALEDEIGVALPATPKHPTLILQADAATSAATLDHVIAAAAARGYTDLLFAVKTK